MRKGHVFLVGAGPGDPGLLTLRGKSVLTKADVVIYDALINTQILQWTKPGAARIFVGKQGAAHSKEQSDINSLLVRKASQGKLVVRLKGGDPFLFGRGGEEAAALAEAGIPFEVISGVTSASGVACYAGIPLTDRRLSSMVTFVTGHESKGKTTAPVDWARISREGTLVIYMGLKELPTIADRLLHHLWDEKTPAAAIHWGSTTRQKVVEATLGTIAAKASEAQLTSPVLVIIGKVVSLRKQLRWFDTRPLFGKRIIVTRASEQAQEFITLLEEAGAEVISMPTIQIVPPLSWSPVDKAIKNVAQYDWLLFTSINGVSMFFSRMREIGGDIRDLKGIRIGAIGPKTSARLNALGLTVDVFPEEYRAESLASALGKVRGSRILLARAEKARDILPKTLTAQGATVTIATVYRTLKPRQIAQEIKKRLADGHVDLVTFTSSSTVDGFMQHLKHKDRRKFFEHTKTAVIGPITADTLRGHGIRPTITARHYTIEALAQAIIRYFQ